jgi:hypothetical protein
VLQDDARIATALGHIAALKGHDRSDHAAILGAVARLPPKQATQRIESILARHAGYTLDSCSALLRAALEGPFAARPGQLITAAKGLISALQGDPATVPADVCGVQRPVRPDPRVIAEFMSTLGRIDAGLPGRLVDHLLAWPQTYSLDEAVVPAVKRLLEGGTARSGPALSRLLAACLAHLELRAAEPLEPPCDWARACDISCSCEHCIELRAFLASPRLPAWRLKAAERARRHVVGNISAARADLDVTTDRRGSPRSLVCHKNSASYERRVAQRRQDLADIKILKGATASA